MRRTEQGRTFQTKRMACAAAQRKGRTFEDYYYSAWQGRGRRAEVGGEMRASSWIQITGASFSV